jgi:hypothetical protein
MKYHQDDKLHIIYLVRLKMCNINIVFLVVLFTASPRVFSYNFTEKTSKEIQIEYVGLKPDNSSPSGQHIEKRSPAHLKKILAIATENNNIANIAAIYLLGRFYQDQNTQLASAMGICAGGFAAMVPVTFGISAIGAVPTIACCTCASVRAHQYRKLKRQAREYLYQNIYSHIVQNILAYAKRINSSVPGLKEMLSKNGINVDNMMK